MFSPKCQISAYLGKSGTRNRVGLRAGIEALRSRHGSLELKASQVYRTSSRTAMATQKTCLKKQSSSWPNRHIETMSQKKVCGPLPPYFMCISSRPRLTWILYFLTIIWVFFSVHTLPSTPTALLRSSFNTRKYQQCVEILCFNELLK